MNILTGIPSLESPNTSFEFNIEAANALLDEAGWVRDGDVRVKNGVELSVEYCTSVNPIRQKTQAVVTEGWEQIGIRVTTCEVDREYSSIALRAMNRTSVTSTATSRCTPTEQTQYFPFGISEAGTLVRRMSTLPRRPISGPAQTTSGMSTLNSTRSMTKSRHLGS